MSLRSFCTRIAALLFAAAAGATAAGADVVLHGNGPEGVYEERGQFTFSIWESAGATGSTRLTWSGKHQQMRFGFDIVEGAIGEAFVRPGVRVDAFDGAPLNATASIHFSRNSDYYFGIYGWVLSARTWDDSQVKHEFYVIQQHRYSHDDEDPRIGSLVVNGVRYDMHRLRLQDGYRFKAIRSGRGIMSGPVDMAPFFAWWRAHGMSNGYLDSIGWALEVLDYDRGGAAGTFALRNISLP